MREPSEAKKWVMHRLLRLFGLLRSADFIQLRNATARRLENTRVYQRIQGNLPFAAHIYETKSRSFDEHGPGDVSPDVPPR